MITPQGRVVRQSVWSLGVPRLARLSQVCQFNLTPSEHKKRDSARSRTCASESDERSNDEPDRSPRGPDTAPPRRAGLGRSPTQANGPRPEPSTSLPTPALNPSLITKACSRKPRRSNERRRRLRPKRRSRRQPRRWSIPRARSWRRSAGLGSQLEQRLIGSPDTVRSRDPGRGDPGTDRRSACTPSFRITSRTCC